MSGSEVRYLILRFPHSFLQDSTPVVSVFLALLARVLIQSPAYFLSLMELVGNQVQPPLSVSVLYLFVGVVSLLHRQVCY